ncbi:MAG: thiamine pyrophosphate-dependent enzyme, partial [Thaumarchaeota archaeon]|nr:thiamine pyrophosphate-dependent enzyme [Nitrososphaerota archaeon]
FGHFEGDLQVYRNQTEVQEWQKRDPIHNLKVRMAHDGTLTDEQFVKLDDEAREKVANAVKFAESSPDPLPQEFEDDVYVSYR